MFFGVSGERIRLAGIWPVMGDETYYLREAQRCQELAATAPDSKTARRWSKLADDYMILAEELDAYIHHRPPILHMPQRVQQQQSKARR